MATSQRQISANQRNGKLSKGPTSVFGRERSKMNALKHGMASRQDTVPGENRRDFEERLDDWCDTLLPVGPVERRLVENAVSATWKLDRVTRVQTARVTTQIENAPQRDLDEIAGLGARLFHDCRQPTQLYGSGRFDHRGERTSWSGIADDPDHPARLVPLMEATAGGVDWLLTEWTALQEQLEPGKTWEGQDKLKCIRLLGCTPLDAANVKSVMQVFAASAILDGRGDDAYASLKGELDEAEYKFFVRGVHERWRPDVLDSSDPEGARRVLVSITERAIGELKAKAAVFEQNAERDAIRRTDCMAIDLSPDGERLRRYELGCTRALLRSLTELTKLRRAAERDARGRNSAVETRSGKDEGGRMKDEEMPDDPQTENLQSTTDTSYDPQTQNEQLITDNPYAPADLDASTPGDCAGLWDKVPNLDIEPNLGDGHLARQRPFLVAAAGESPAQDRRDEVPNLDIEPNLGDGHLAHREPVIPADAAGPASPNQRNEVPNLDIEPNLGVGQFARQQPLLVAEAEEALTPDQEDDASNLDIEPSLGDGHLARREPVIPADSAEPASPNLRNQLPNLPWEPPPPRFSPIKASEFHMAVMKDLRRHDAGAKAEGGFRRRDRRGRPRRDSTDHHDQGFCNPAALEIRKHSPLLASLSNARFTKLLDEVHREFEEELT